MIRKSAHMEKGTGMDEKEKKDNEKNIKVDNIDKDKVKDKVIESNLNDIDGEGIDEAKEFSDIYRRPPFDTYGVAAKAFGQASADFAKHLAESDFAGFKAGMRSIGFPTLYEDEPDGIWARGLTMYSNKMPRLANVALCLRYPFLVPRSRWSGDVIWYDEIDGAMWDETRAGVMGGTTKAFGTTELDAMPLGWLARFGLEICEDIKAVLESSREVSRPMECYHIEQIKEKWGSLRWYSAGTPRDVYEDEQRVIDLYELISTRTCIGCGGHDRVRMTGGYVSYDCFRCRSEYAGQLDDERVLGRYNEMVADGSLADLIGRQSDAWGEDNEVDDAYVASIKPLAKYWEIPHRLRTLVAKDILDTNSHAVGSIEDDRIYVTQEFVPKAKEPVRHETDLFEWGDGLGLLGVGLARSVDRMRRYFDGDTNIPSKGDEGDGEDAEGGEA